MQLKHFPRTYISLHNLTHYLTSSFRTPYLIHFHNHSSFCQFQEQTCHILKAFAFIFILFPCHLALLASSILQVSAEILAHPEDHHLCCSVSHNCTFPIKHLNTLCLFMSVVFIIFYFLN